MTLPGLGLKPRETPASTLQNENLQCTSALACAVARVPIRARLVHPDFPNQLYSLLLPQYSLLFPVLTQPTTFSHVQHPLL
jgi:hypothetical protein